MKAIGRLAYRLVISLPLPLAWVLLNQFWAPLYTGKEPRTAFFLVVTAQHYIERPVWILLPVAVDVAIHLLWRWIRVLIAERGSVDRLDCFRKLPPRWYPRIS